MSTKTNFKRIALVAVASLGLSICAAVPSNAAVLQDSFTVTTAAGTATKSVSDSTTAGTLTVKYTATEADTLVVTFAPLSKPTAATVTPLIRIFGGATGTETTQATAASGADTTTSTGATGIQIFKATNNTNANTIITNDTAIITSSANNYNAASFLVFMDSTTGTRVAGTYTYTAIITQYERSNPVVAPSQRVNTKTATLTFTITAAAAESTVPSAAQSTAYLSASGGASSDEVVYGVSTTSTTPTALLEVKLRNASGSSGTVAGKESVTVTTNAGTVGIPGGTFGRSVVLPYTSTGVGAGDSLTVYVRPDGTNGTATITVSTPSVTFTSKTVVFYASAPATLVATALNTVPGTGANSAALSVVAKDASGNTYAGTLYTYSSATGTISNDAASCSYSAANGRHECSITGVAAGTATVTVRNAATVAASTVASSAVSFTVVDKPAATVQLAWDKATYAPGEKATLRVSVLGSDGKSVAAGTFANLFATGGITLSAASGNGSDTLTAVSITTASPASAATGTSTVPVKEYTVYMPASGGTLKASATGGVSLPAAGQVAVSASATATDNGSAALAAVNALATTVAQLRTLITTLTNLVLKIQKKVKA